MHNPEVREQQMNALLSPPLEAMLLDRRIVLRSVSWDSYITIAEALDSQPGLRLTYDRGSLEFMTTSNLHEFLKKWYSRFVEVITEECDLPIATFGSMTFQRADLEQGFEPDDCFWIEHELQLRGRRDYHPTNDSPPDLLIEIEVSRSEIDRMAIYATMGIPEVWRIDAQQLIIEVLQPDQTYQQSTSSRSFPNLPITELTRFLPRSPQDDSLTLIRALRNWVRQHTP